MKKEKIILFIIIILLSLFLISNLIPKPYISGDSAIEGKIVSVDASLSILIICEDSDVVPASGNVSFNEQCTNRAITLLTGLTENWTVNISLFDDDFPDRWNEPEPSENEIETEFKYFELNVDNDTEGSYKIYFIIAQDVLGGVSPGDVRLFVYISNWTELPTTIVNSISDPVEFYAVTTRFSKFLIGEKVTEVPSEEPPILPVPVPVPARRAGCFHKLECGNWSICIDSKQTRICKDTGTCLPEDRIEERKCEMPPILEEVPEEVIIPIEEMPIKLPPLIKWGIIVIAIIIIILAARAGYLLTKKK